ncbi:MAG: sulfite exporter TauE/SafE family protein, partial [Burkholderiales bacterium]|nr:sulfite exporter TauE/SafE family protein [Burkholderiales bacterium]
MKSSLLVQWLRCSAFLILLGLVPGISSAEEFLEPERAFQLQAELHDSKSLILTWAIAKDYHLYRERLNFKADAPDIVLGKPALPDGIRKFDENFNKTVEIYEKKLLVELPVTKVEHAFTLTITYQGCADAGLCYPPVDQRFRVDPLIPGKLTLLTDASANTASTVTTPTPAVKELAENEDDSSLAQRTLQSGSLWRIGIAFLVFGLLLSFTPCVLPMVPILSSIIVGEGSVSRSRGFLLALSYCLGMALIYTLMGVAAGLAGEGLAGSLQKPWVLLTFSALLIGLALSMFDVYQLQLPAGLQSRLSQASG